MPRHHHYNEPLSSGQEEAFLPSGGLSNKDKIFMTRRKERKKEKGFVGCRQGLLLDVGVRFGQSPSFTDYYFWDRTELHMLVYSVSFQFWNHQRLGSRLPKGLKHKYPPFTRQYQDKFWERTI